MNRTMIAHRIGEVLDDLSRLNSHICAMGSLDIQRYPENYETLSTEAALRAEKVTCKLRNLLYASAGISKQEYLVQAGDVQGIEICYEDGILEITLPRLLPKKRGKQSSLFLSDPLHAALEHYATQHSLPHFRECVVCIVHIYDHELPDWCLLDYDNLQQKQILDTIALHVMMDDSGLLCDAYNTTELGEKNATCICIMEKSRFSEWLSKREKPPKSISDFQLFDT